MDEQELYCLGLHFKYLYEQAINKKPVDFAEPCGNCKYLQGCKGNWLRMRNALKKATGIDVSVIIHDSTRLKTEDN